MATPNEEKEIVAQQQTRLRQSVDEATKTCTKSQANLATRTSAFNAATDAVANATAILNKLKAELSQAKKQKDIAATECSQSETALRDFQQQLSDNVYDEHITAMKKLSFGELESHNDKGVALWGRLYVDKTKSVTIFDGKWNLDTIEALKATSDPSACVFAFSYCDYSVNIDDTDTTANAPVKPETKPKDTTNNDQDNIDNSSSNKESNKESSESKAVEENSSNDNRSSGGTSPFVSGSEEPKLALPKVLAAAAGPKLKLPEVLAGHFTLKSGRKVRSLGSMVSAQVNTLAG